MFAWKTDIKISAEEDHIGLNNDRLYFGLTKCPHLGRNHLKRLWFIYSHWTFGGEDQSAWF